MTLEAPSPMPEAVSQTRDPRSAWQLAGILALASAVLTVLALILNLTNFGFEPSSQLTLIVVGAVLLALLGGILALTGARKAAPWLLIAAFVIGYALPTIRGGAFVDLVPLATFRFLPDAISFDFVWAAFIVLNELAYVACIAAVVLSLIALSRGGSVGAATASTATTTPAVVAGLAVPQADGTIAAGWYADPDGKPAERYWDGTAWTEQSRPRTIVTAPNGGASGRLLVDAQGNAVSPSNRLIAFLLLLFLGYLGVHRFYVGKVGTGLLMLFTLGGLGIWVFVDFILILAGAFRDKQGRRVLNWS